MLTKIKHFFSKPERAHRARARVARRIRQELGHLQDVRQELTVREKVLLKRMYKIAELNLNHELLDRRARGW